MSDMEFMVCQEIQLGLRLLNYLMIPIIVSFSDMPSTTKN